MSALNIFKVELEKSLLMLSEDEWAVAKLRDNFVKNLEPHEAFSEIMNILNLALEQKDEYAFDTCCCLAVQLAEKAETTECPEGLKSLIHDLKSQAKLFSSYSVNEVEKVASWFRL